MRHSILLFVFLFVGTSCISVLAQQSQNSDAEKINGNPQNVREEGRERRKEEMTRKELLLGDADEQFAAVMFTYCKNEAELARFVQPMLKSTAAKEYAQRVAQDSQSQGERLQKLAGHYHEGVGISTPSTTSSTPPQTTSNLPNATEPRAKFEFGRLKFEASANAIRSATSGSHPHAAVVLDWVQIQHEIANECLASAKAELQRREGKYFDESYIGMEVAAQMKKVDCLKVFQKHASGPIRNQIESNLELAQSHLKEAKAIMESQAQVATSK